MSSAAMWAGPVQTEGHSVYARAVADGMSALRALVIGHVGSFKDGWIFRRNIAQRVGVSIRTVQRALTEACERGLIRTARAKQGELPPGLKHPLPCGWSHRWVIGWGQAGEAVKNAVEQARAAWQVRKVNRTAIDLVRNPCAPREPLRPPLGKDSRKEKRKPPPGMSALDWLNGELAKLPPADLAELLDPDAKPPDK